MSSTPSDNKRRCADGVINLITILFRVLEMAKEFPLVEFRGLDQGACSSDPW
jgi:hypothetical protein